jgi:hypothetical protein
VALSVSTVYPARLQRQPPLRAKRATSDTDDPGDRACPTLTQGRVAILHTQKDILGRVPDLDYLLLLPDGPHGCQCDRCVQRGRETIYLDLTQRIDEVARTVHPEVRVILCDWPGQTDDTHGGTEALVAALSTDARPWVDYLALRHPEAGPLGRLHPLRLSLLQAAPPGMERYGAVPALKSSPVEWREQVDAGPNHRGFVMRTRGTHDHLNVLAALRWHWSPRRTPENLAYYITRYHFGDAAVQQLIPVLLQMDPGTPDSREEGTPFPANGSAPADLLARARARERTVRAVGDRLPRADREGLAFQCLWTRVTAEVKYWEAAQ